MSWIFNWMSWILAEKIEHAYFDTSGDNVRLQIIMRDNFQFQNLASIKLPKIDPEQYRSSRLEVFCRKGVLRNFAKFMGKHLCQSLFFNKVPGLRPATLLKKRIRYRCFPVNFPKFLRTPLFTEHLRWLLLTIPFL